MVAIASMPPAAEQGTEQAWYLGIEAGRTGVTSCTKAQHGLLTITTQYAVRSAASQPASRPTCSQAVSNHALGGVHLDVRQIGEHLKGKGMESGIMTRKRNKMWRVNAVQRSRP